MDVSTLQAAKVSARANHAPISPPALGTLHAALAARDSGPVVVAATGSSTTVGSFASTTAKNYVSLIGTALQAAYPLDNGATSPATVSLATAVAVPPSAPGVQMINAGVTGTDADTYLTSTTRAQLAALNPRAIIHMIGSNDFAASHTLSAYRASVAGQIAALKATITVPCVHILVHTYHRLDVLTTRAPYWSDFAAQLQAIAAADPDNVAYIDASAAFHFAGVPGTDPLDLVQADLIHATDRGYTLLADRILDALQVAREPMRSGTPAAPAARARWTSDMFTAATGELVGKSTDAALGGAAKTWTGTTGAVVINASGQLEQTTPGNFVVGVAMPHPDYEVSVRLPALPTVNSIILGLRRAAVSLGQDTLYLDVASTGAMVFGKRVSSVFTGLATGFGTAAAGDRVSLGILRGVVTVRLNGIDVLTYPLSSTDQTTFAAAGAFAISGSGTTAAKADDLTVDILT